MNSLELKIPPPLVALSTGAAMWALSLLPPVVQVPVPIRVAAALGIATPGGLFALAGAIGVRRSKTTVNPRKPQQTSSLVTAGVFALTRNPMYVGLLFALLAWAAFLCSLWAVLLGPAVFVLYLNRFQIRPEERVLSEQFGAEYTDYHRRVRRWL